MRMKTREIDDDNELSDLAKDREKKAHRRKNQIYDTIAVCAQICIASFTVILLVTALLYAWNVIFLNLSDPLVAMRVEKIESIASSYSHVFVAFFAYIIASFKKDHK